MKNMEMMANETEMMAKSFARTAKNMEKIAKNMEKIAKNMEKMLAKTVEASSPAGRYTVAAIYEHAHDTIKHSQEKE